MSLGQKIAGLCRELRSFEVFTGQRSAHNLPGINAVALIYWWMTLATKTPNTCGEGACPRSAAQQS
ncbi:hypothetical protein BZL43_06740 [Pseudomonas sp. PICF141]|nr:hypothetical protein BZL43_06740 [Pseudomonas sp. PICF141]